MLLILMGSYKSPNDRQEKAGAKNWQLPERRASLLKGFVVGSVYINWRI
jgi:hypothetical protein